MVPSLPTNFLTASLAILPFKIGFVTFAGLYFIFSLIVIRQVFLMTDTVKTVNGPVLRLIGLFFSFASLMVLIYFIASLG